MCVHLGGLSVPYGDELLGDHRQHLDVDTVELVKAAPGARLSQSAEEAAHHLQDGGKSVPLKIQKVSRCIRTGHPEG